MCSSIDKDIEFCDAYMDISQNEKRIVRASVKTYEITGSYISIKLFKQDDNKDFKFNQKVTLTLTEFEKLLANGAKIKTLLTPKRKPRQKRSRKTYAQVLKSEESESEKEQSC